MTLTMMSISNEMVSFSFTSSSCSLNQGSEGKHGFLMPFLKLACTLFGVGVHHVYSIPYTSQNAIRLN